MTWRESCKLSGLLPLCLVLLEADAAMRIWTKCLFGYGKHTQGARRWDQCRDVVKPVTTVGQWSLNPPRKL